MQPSCLLVPQARLIRLHLDQPFFIFSRPRTVPAFCDGSEALVFFFSALGLRTSLFDFFWLLAMTFPVGAECPARELHLIDQNSAMKS
jgi:hypothetical protein